MKFLLPFVLAFSLLFMSCATKTRSGALAGGVVGAGAGAAIGGGKGALIGGAAGVATGALIGHYLDEQDRKLLKKSSPSTISRVDNGEHLSINDVVKLSQAGVSDDKMIKYMKDHPTTYNLTQEQVNTMKEGGVSQRVISYMLNTGR